jgi:hypothetical protein
MRHYQNLQGQSGVVSYALANDAILVEFKKGATYLYTATILGREKFEKMKLLAEAGKGLNTFISQNVRDVFNRKFN